MSIIWSGLMPHPPIIIASVGKHRALSANQTILACQAIAKNLLKHEPKRVVLISPHSPRTRQGVSFWQKPQLEGDFSQFGAPDCHFTLPNDLPWLETWIRSYPDAEPIPDQSLDHGASVPLYFLKDAGWNGPTVVMGLPSHSGLELRRLGESIKKACHDFVPTGLLASGDMSHCLKNDGPYGFDPAGEQFDTTFLTAVKQGNYHKASQIDAFLRNSAMQDVLESSEVAWYATDFNNRNRYFYNYEAPFGVGYGVMRFFGKQP